MANRSTWPSADLWKRLPDIKDDTACPWCECPAATHLRDPTVGVWYCPIQLDAPEDRKLPEYQTQKTKLWEMLKKANGTGPFARAIMAPAELWNYMSKEANRNIEYLKKTYPDFEELRPILVRVIARSPEIGIDQAITEARTIRAAQVEKAKSADRATIGGVLKEVYGKITFTREQIEGSARSRMIVESAKQRKAAESPRNAMEALTGEPGEVIRYAPSSVDRLDRMRARKENAEPSTVPSTVGTGKRKYNLDEDL